MRCALRLGRVDNRRLRDGGQPSHRSGEDFPFVAASGPMAFAAHLPLSPITERLRRAIFLWRIALPQAIAVDEDHPARHPPVMDARFAFAGSPLGKEGLQPCHLRFCQPEEVAQTQDQWVLTLALDGNQHAPDQAGGVRLGHKTTTVSLHKRHSRRLLRDQLRSIHAAYPRTQSWQVL